MQALEHSEKAVELSSSDVAKSEASHVLGGIQKDLGLMEEAKRVSYSCMFHCVLTISFATSSNTYSSFSRHITCTLHLTVIYHCMGKICFLEIDLHA